MPASPPPSDDLSLALHLADIAGEISTARFRATDLRVETKPDLTPVSDADRAVETAIRTQQRGEVARWPLTVGRRPAV